MSDKVYLVSSGTHSNYKIIAIFSTREKAEKIAKRFNANLPKQYTYVYKEDEARIEEYELDMSYAQLKRMMAL